MGVDLKLYFIDVHKDDAQKRRLYSRTVMELERQRELNDAIMVMGPRPITIFEVVPFYGEAKPLTHCAYGKPITFLKVWELKNAFQYIGDELYKPNKAILAYLCELDPEQPVALYWH